MKQLSSHAAVAKECRVILKKVGIKARVSSKTYSGGQSVNVFVTDIHPWIKKSIDERLAIYEKGDFNGFEDIYEYKRDGYKGPRVKYLFVRNDMSAEMRSKVEKFLADNWDITDNNTAKEKMNTWYDQAINKVFYGEIKGFWDE